MAAQIQNGIEIEIIVRSRKNGRPVGKAGHAFVVSEDEAAGEAGRKRIVDEAKARVDEYMKSRLVGPAE